MMGVVSAASIIGGGDGQARRAAASDHPTRNPTRASPPTRGARATTRGAFPPRPFPPSDTTCLAHLLERASPPTRVHPPPPPYASSPSSRPTRAARVFTLVATTDARHSFLLRDDADVSRDTVALRTTPPAGSVDEEKRRPNVPDVSVDDPVVPVPDVFVDDPVVPPPAPALALADDDVLGSFGRLNFSWKGALVLYGRGRPDLVRNCRFAGAVSRRISMSRSVPARRRVRKRVGENWTRGRRRVASAKKWTGGS